MLSRCKYLHYKKFHYNLLLDPIWTSWFILSFTLDPYDYLPYHRVTKTLRRRARKIHPYYILWDEEDACREMRLPYESRDTLSYRRCISWSVTRPRDGDRWRTCHIPLPVWSCSEWWCDHAEFLWELRNCLWCPYEAHESLYFEYDLCTDEVMQCLCIEVAHNSQVQKKRTKNKHWKTEWNRPLTSFRMTKRDSLRKRHTFYYFPQGMLSWTFVQFTFIVRMTKNIP